MRPNEYDIIVIGGGAAGFVSAKMARGFGKKTAMVEKKKLGGECTWTGCIPSKTLIKTAGVSWKVNELKKYGLRLNRAAAVRTDGVMGHVRSVIHSVYDTHKPGEFIKEGIDVIFGSPRFTGPRTIKVGKKEYTAGRFVIATGSSPMMPPIPGIDTVPCLTNETVFQLKKIPSSLAVLGGGPIGVELAAAFNRLGAKTTLIEMMDSILVREERELTDELAGALEKEGLKIMTGTRVVMFRRSRGKTEITAETKNGKRVRVAADEVLVAVGRKPNVEGMDLEKAGIDYSAKGITVDGHLRTTAKHIYACGDVAGPYQFSHMAEYQAVIAAGNALLPFKRKVNYDSVPWATFTDPELARSGMTEEDARRRYGSRVRVYRYRYDATDRGRTEGTGAGMSKIVLKRNGKILGIHILGPSAAEIMHELQLAKTLGINFKKVRSAIHAYPSFSDVIRQPSKVFYVDSIRENFFVKTILKLLAAVKGE